MRIFDIHGWKDRFKLGVKGGKSSFVGKKLYYNVWFLVDTNLINAWIHVPYRMAAEKRGRCSKVKSEVLLDFQAGIRKVETEPCQPGSL